jgi:hypothetical protein
MEAAETRQAAANRVRIVDLFELLNKLNGSGFLVHRCRGECHKGDQLGRNSQILKRLE